MKLAKLEESLKATQERMTEFMRTVGEENNPVHLVERNSEREVEELKNLSPSQRGVMVSHRVVPFLDPSSVILLILIGRHV